jgi:hypothetical protein
MRRRQQFRDFMPEGMIFLFEGINTFGRHPPGYRFEVGPPRPSAVENDLAATERYAQQL